MIKINLNHGIAINEVKKGGIKMNRGNIFRWVVAYNTNEIKLQ